VNETHGHAELTPAEAKNFAVALTEAVVALGRSARANTRTMHVSHKDRCQQIAETLERLYWQTKSLEHDTHARLAKSLQQGEPDDAQ
jgi:hypothetical protein